MKVIRLSQSNSGWNAEFLMNGQPDLDAVRLFGSHIIPTAFTKHAKAVDVAHMISVVNPGYAVHTVDQQEG